MGVFVWFWCCLGCLVFPSAGYVTYETNKLRQTVTVGWEEAQQKPAWLLFGLVSFLFGSGVGSRPGAQQQTEWITGSKAQTTCFRWFCLAYRDLIEASVCSETSSKDDHQVWQASQALLYVSSGHSGLSQILTTS